MINIQNVTKVYNGKVKAVDNISLAVEDGQIVGFIGPNGAGKTTTLKMITGILNSDTGNISLNGFDIRKDPIKAKKQFGFVPDNSGHIFTS
jgi:ABC-2 type transport system ATP-binding protein